MIQSKHITSIMYGIFAYTHYSFSYTIDLLDCNSFMCQVFLPFIVPNASLKIYLCKISHFSTTSKHIMSIMYGIFAYTHYSFSCTIDLLDCNSFMCQVFLPFIVPNASLKIYLCKISHFSTTIWKEKEFHLGLIHTKATPLRF